MQVGKWGNSLAIRLPSSIVELLGLQEGDDVEIESPGRVSSVSGAMFEGRRRWID